MVISRFSFNEGEQLVSWLGEGAEVRLANVRQAVFDVDRDSVVVILKNPSARLEVYGARGILMECEAPGNSEFQYLLVDKNRRVLVVSSERNPNGDTLDWFYEIDLVNRSLVKDGRSY